MISQKYRFHGHTSLKYVFSNGKMARGKNISIKYIENTRRRNSRVSVIVSKKVLRHAVGRNRARRRIYEIIRTRISNFNRVVDVAIIIYNDSVLEMPNTQLSHEVDACLDKLGIIKQD